MTKTDKEYNKRYYAANREKEAVRCKKWRLANMDHKRAYDKQYREKNLQRRLDASRNWYWSHREDYVIINKIWREEHPEHIKRYDHTRRVRKKCNGGAYTIEEIRELWDKQNGICYYCGKLIYSSLDKERHIDHKLPISRGGSNDISNIALTCARCNLSKHTKTAEEYLATFKNEHE